MYCSSIFFKNFIIFFSEFDWGFFEKRAENLFDGVLGAVASRGFVGLNVFCLPYFSRNIKILLSMDDWRFFEKYVKKQLFYIGLGDVATRRPGPP